MTQSTQQALQLVSQLTTVIRSISTTEEDLRAIIKDQQTKIASLEQQLVDSHSKSVEYAKEILALRQQKSDFELQRDIYNLNLSTTRPSAPDLEPQLNKYVLSPVPKTNIVTVPYTHTQIVNTQSKTILNLIGQSKHSPPKYSNIKTGETFEIRLDFLGYTIFVQKCYRIQFGESQAADEFLRLESHKPDIRQFMGSYNPYGNQNGSSPSVESEQANIVSQEIEDLLKQKAMDNPFDKNCTVHGHKYQLFYDVLFNYMMFIRNWQSSHAVFDRFLLLNDFIILSEEVFHLLWHDAPECAKHHPLGSIVGKKMVDCMVWTRDGDLADVIQPLFEATKCKLTWNTEKAVQKTLLRPHIFTIKYFPNWIVDPVHEQEHNRLWGKFKEGGFNPYGNGQTAADIGSAQIITHQTFPEDNVKEDRYSKRQRIRKQKDNHKRVLAYERLIHQAENDGSARNLQLEVNRFNQLLIDRGYDSPTASQVPASIRNLALEHWVEGYGLIHCGTLHRLNKKHREWTQKVKGYEENMPTLQIPTTQPKKGRELRKLVLKTAMRWHKNRAHGVSEMQAVVSWLMPSLTQALKAELTKMNLIPTPALALADNITKGWEMIKSFTTTQLKAVGITINPALFYLMTAILFIGFFGSNPGILVSLGIISTNLLVIPGKSEMYHVTHDDEVNNPEPDEEDIPNAVGVSVITQFLMNLGEWMYGAWRNFKSINWREMMASVSKFAVDFRNIKEFFRSISELWTDFVDWVSEQWTGLPWRKEARLMKALQALDSDLMRAMSTGDPTAPANRDYAKKFIDLYEEYRKVSHQLLLKADKEQQSLIKSANFRYLEHYRLCMCSLAGDKPRQRPVWLDIVGETNQGKSNFVKLIAEAVYFALGLPNWNPSEIEFRNQSEEFWSNYNGKFALCIDDYLQISDSLTRASQAMEIISIVNEVPMSLIMPDLERKGKTFMNSKFFITTSNTDGFPGDLGIICEPAVWRRRDFLIRLTLKSGIERTSNIGSSAADNYNIQVALDVTSKTTQWKTISFEDLVVMISINYLKYEQAYHFVEDKLNYDWSKVISRVPIRPMIGDAAAMESYTQSLVDYMKTAGDLQTKYLPEESILKKDVDITLLDIEMRRSHLRSKFASVIAEIPGTHIIKDREIAKYQDVILKHRKIPKPGLRKFWYAGENRFAGDLVPKEYRLILPEFMASKMCMPDTCTGQPISLVSTVLQCPLPDCGQRLIMSYYYLEDGPPRVTVPNYYGLICSKCDYSRSLYAPASDWTVKEVEKVLQKPTQQQPKDAPTDFQKYHGMALKEVEWGKLEERLEYFEQTLSSFDEMNRYCENVDDELNQHNMDLCDQAAKMCRLSKNVGFVDQVRESCKVSRVKLEYFMLQRRVDNPDYDRNYPDEEGYNEGDDIELQNKFKKMCSLIRHTSSSELSHLIDIINQLKKDASDEPEIQMIDNPPEIDGSEGREDSDDEVQLLHKKKGKSQGFDWYTPSIRNNLLYVPEPYLTLRLDDRLKFALLMAGRVAFTWSEFSTIWPDLYGQSSTWKNILNPNTMYHPYMKEVTICRSIVNKKKVEGFNRFCAEDSNILSLEARFTYLKENQGNIWTMWTQKEYRSIFCSGYDVMARQEESLLESQAYLARWAKCKGNMSISEIGLIMVGAIALCALLGVIATILYVIVEMARGHGLKPNKFLKGKSESDSKFSKKQLAVKRAQTRKAIHHGASEIADPNAITMMDKAFKNIYRVKILFPDGRIHKSYVFMISGQIGFMARHAVYAYKENGMVPEQLDIDFASKGTEFGHYHVKDFTFVDFENKYNDGFRDIVGVILPNVPLSVDISGFLSDVPITSKIQQPVRIERTEKGLMNTTSGTCLYRELMVTEMDKVAHDATPVVLEDNLFAEGMDHDFDYCGFPIMVKNPTIDKKLKGLHVGGTAEGSSIEEITLDMFRKVVRVANGNKSQCFAEIGFCEPYRVPGFTVEFKEEILEDKYIGYRAIGKLTRPIFTPTKTKLEATIVQKGCVVDQTKLSPPYQHREAPALLGMKRLKDGSIIDPWTLSLRKLATKMGMPQIELLYDPRVWNGVFKDKLKDYDLKALTVKEAICGTRDGRQIPSIDKTTSPTFPYVQEGYKREDLFTIEIIENGKIVIPYWISSELEGAINYILQMMENGMIDPHFVIGCLKDERRTLDKVEAGHTRMFKVGGLARLIVTRMYIMPFMIAVEKSLCTDIMVGCNPGSSDWKRMYDSMKKLSNAQHIVAQDVSGWDLHYYQCIIRAFCVQYASFLDVDVQSVLIRYLYMSLIANIVVYVILKELVSISSEMPSGVVLTSFFNSVLNSVKHRICFLIRMLRMLGHVLDFDEWNYLRVFGDDSIMAIHAEIISIWNGLVLAQMAKELFNHDHTSSQKGELKPFEDISEVFFLQRQFRPYEGMVLSPLNRITLEGMVQWIMKSKEQSHAEIFKIVCHNALIEWANYGPKEFDKQKATLNSFLRYYRGDYCFNEKWEDVMAVLVKRVTTKA